MYAMESRRKITLYKFVNYLILLIDYNGKTERQKSVF